MLPSVPGGRSAKERPDSTDLPSDLQNPAFARLEARAVSMLLNSVPESVSSQALATRSLSSVVGIIFQVLKQFQPRGLMERQELLKSLTELQVATSGQEAVLILQAWFRHVARARTMQVQLRDGSILLAALDALSQGILSQHAHVAFRLNLSRHQLKLDYKAELETVEEYARSLLAEFEVLALSSHDPSAPKRPRLKKIKDQDQPSVVKDPPAPPLTKGTGKGTNPSSDTAAERQHRGAGRLCSSWMSAEGCANGDKCRFTHQVDEEAMKGRCFYCSSENHWANTCPVKAARKAEVRAGRQSAPSDGKGAKAKGKGKPAGQVLLVLDRMGQVPLHQGPMPFLLPFQLSQCSG